MVPNLTGRVGHALRDLPHRRILQIAATDRAGDLREHTRLEEVVQDVAARIGDRADIVDRRLGLLRKARPCGSADSSCQLMPPTFFVVMRIAVGADVEAGRLPARAGSDDTASSYCSR